MNIDLILSSLGWAALHSIWQGFLAAGLVYGLRGLFKSQDVNFRYSFQFLSLVACLVAFVITFSIYAVSGAETGTVQTVTTSFSEFVQLATLSAEPAAQGGSINVSALLNQYSPLLGALWVLGFLTVSARCAVSFQMTQALRKKGLSPAPQEWIERFAVLARQAGLPRLAKIYISSQVSGPLTLGFFKPLVLVPASFFTQLPQDQIEAVLLHEIAHIRRHDYVLNIVQTAIKAVFFYHPGIHYISRQINETREYACDDFSVGTTKNPKALAMALAALRISHPENSFAMAAEGKNGKSSPMLARLQRLIKTSPADQERGQVTVPVIALTLSTALFFSIAPLSEAHPDPDPKPSEKYEHAKAKRGNYTFKTIPGKNGPVTVKVTQDGRRWILADGAWYDIDKAPHMIKALPVMPVAPVPPVPPVIAGVENAGSKTSEKAMRKFEKKMDQFEIDMQYFEKSMENWAEQYSETYGEEYAKKWAEWGEEFGESFGKEFAENFDWEDMSEAEGEDLENHPHDGVAERALHKAEVLRERMLERAEEQRERAEEEREAVMERAEEQREAAMERMEEHREAAMERAEEQREAMLERAEEERERAMERIERDQERAERTMERAQRDAERAKRDVERAERDAERAVRDAERHAKRKNKYGELRSTLYSQLIADKLVSSADEPVTIRYKNKRWTANGTPVPKATEGKYCDLFSEHKIHKNKDTVLKFKPKQISISSHSKDGNSHHEVTVGTFDHDKHDDKKHEHKDKFKTKSWDESHNIQFIQPVSGAKLTGRFNEAAPNFARNHRGIDLAAKKGTPVYASAAGTVELVTTEPAWGHRVIINHDDGYQTIYANLGGFNVKRGECVKAGEKIGKVGSSSENSSGPHLHFEIKLSDKLVDPEDIIASF